MNLQSFLHWPRIQNIFKTSFLFLNLQKKLHWPRTQTLFETFLWLLDLHKSEAIIHQSGLMVKRDLSAEFMLLPTCCNYWSLDKMFAEPEHSDWRFMGVCLTISEQQTASIWVKSCSHEYGIPIIHIMDATCIPCWLHDYMKLGIRSEVHVSKSWRFCWKATSTNYR